MIESIKMMIRYYLFVSFILILPMYGSQASLEQIACTFPEKSSEVITVDKKVLLCIIERVCINDAILISQIYEGINKEFGVVPDSHKDEWYTIMVRNKYNCFNNYISSEDKDRALSEEKSISLVKHMINSALNVEKTCNISMAIQEEIERLDRRNARSSLLSSF